MERLVTANSAAGSHYERIGATSYGVGASAGHKGTYTGPNGTTLQYNYKGGAAGYAHGAHGAAVTGSGGDALPRGY